MKKKFILIGHKKKHGKDTFAKMLKEHLGNAEILSFADPMRAIMAQMKGMSVEEYKETYNANEDWRDELKTFGNGEILNYTSELFWRDVLLRRANKLDCEYIIVPDFRFLREQIEGATYVKIQNDRVDSNDEHQSETELDNFEFEHIVMNNKGLKELGIIAKEFANYLEPDEESLSIEDIIQMIFDPNQGIYKAHEAMMNKMETRDELEVDWDEVRERVFKKEPEYVAGVNVKEYLERLEDAMPSDYEEGCYCPHRIHQEPKAEVKVVYVRAHIDSEGNIHIP